MWEQSGVYKVVLKENIGKWIHYESGAIAGISTTGETVTLLSCDNIYLNYDHKLETGVSGKLLSEYSINVAFFDLTKETDTTLDILSSIFGFIPIFYFRNGDIKALLTPIFLEDDFSYNEIDTQVFNIILKTQVKTTNLLIDYEEITEGSAILAEDASAILAEDGSSILTD